MIIDKCRIVCSAVFTKIKPLKPPISITEISPYCSCLQLKESYIFNPVEFQKQRSLRFPYFFSNFSSNDRLEEPEPGPKRLTAALNWALHIKHVPGLIHEGTSVYNMKSKRWRSTTYEDNRYRCYKSQWCLRTKKDEALVDVSSCVFTC